MMQRAAVQAAQQHRAVVPGLLLAGGQGPKPLAAGVSSGPAHSAPILMGGMQLPPELARQFMMAQQLPPAQQQAQLQWIMQQAAMQQRGTPGGRGGGGSQSRQQGPGTAQQRPARPHMQARSLSSAPPLPGRGSQPEKQLLRPGAPQPSMQQGRESNGGQKLPPAAEQAAASATAAAAATAAPAGPDAATAEQPAAEQAMAEQPLQEQEGQQQEEQPLPQQVVSPEQLEARQRMAEEERQRRLESIRKAKEEQDRENRLLAVERKRKAGVIQASTYILGGGS